MFDGATSADPDFASFDFVAGTNFVNMMRSVTMSSLGYATLLIRIENTNAQASLNLHGGTSQYDSSAATARANLIGRGWTITDSGVAP
jgi:hypothetical protein